jgi:hypothetical protein
MGFFKTQEEKEEGRQEREKLKVEIQSRNESRRKASQEQYKINEEIRNLYRERIREERRLREKRNSED